MGTYIPLAVKGIDSFAGRWRHKHKGQSLATYRVVGFCLLTKREVIDCIGGLDEQFGNGNFEDDDFCLRAALAGYKARIAHDVFIHHTGNQTFKKAGIDPVMIARDNGKLFNAKWGITPNAICGSESPLPFQNISGLSIYMPLPYRH